MERQIRIPRKWCQRWIQRHCDVQWVVFVPGNARSIQSSRRIRFDWRTHIFTVMPNKHTYNLAVEAQKLVRIPKDRWPAEWAGKFSKPVKFVIYAHPDAGGYWESHCKDRLIAGGLTPVPDWTSIYWHRNWNCCSWCMLMTSRCPVPAKTRARDGYSSEHRWKATNHRRQANVWVGSSRDRIVPALGPQSVSFFQVGAEGPPSTGRQGLKSCIMGFWRNAMWKFVAVALADKGWSMEVCRLKAWAVIFCDVEMCSMGFNDMHHCNGI